MKQALRRHWQGWINRRLPRADRCRYDRHRIFILPTGAGALFGLLLLVMLITGINYQNSLIYLLAFLLGAVFVAAMHQTHNNLSGMELMLLRAGEGFCGEPVPFHFRITAEHDVQVVELSVEQGGRTRLSVASGDLADGALAMTPERRGWFRPERVRVETRFPFGLLKAWSWLRPSTPAIVYPKPLLPALMPDTTAEGEEAEARYRTRGQDQIELRPWREGDLSARVDWKRFSRSGDMIVADWQGEQGSPQWLDFDAFTGVDTELRLSYLTGLLLQRDAAGLPYGLRLPGRTLEPDTGNAHRVECLRALALYGLPDAAVAGGAS